MKGECARLSFLCLVLGPDVHERGVELLEKHDRIGLGHIGGEDEGKNSVGDASLDGMNPHDFTGDHEVQALADVADGLLLQVHGAAPVEGKPEGIHPVAGVLRHDVGYGAQLDAGKVVFVKDGNGGGSLEENPGAHGDQAGVGSELSAGGKKEKGRQRQKQFPPGHCGRGRSRV